uniref:Uncharacterized protein n=1 Tax=Lactuca sativa TaxID=4236 RepID=A0A9R1XQP4_LACSA|nr:hypothetical protein LSAT_V11C200072500 [Lactuca sativa]
MNVANSGQASVPGPPGVHNPSEVGTMVNSQDSYAQPVAIAATHGVVDVYQAYGGAANGQTLHVQVTYAENYGTHQDPYSSAHTSYYTHHNQKVLLKSLNVDLKEVSPSSLLMDKVREVEGNPDFSNKMSGQLNNHQWLEKLKKQIELLLEIIVIFSKNVLECEFKLMTLLHINLINRLYNEMQRIIMGRRLSINLMNAANDLARVYIVEPVSFFPFFSG